MREARPSFRGVGLFDTALGIRPRLAGAKPLRIVLALAVVAMSVSARAQSGDGLKPPAPTQSSEPVPPPPDAQTSSQPPQSVLRTVTVTFDYDFSKLPACSAKRTQKCMQQFNVYEVSATKPIFLFSIPVPSNANGKVIGITGSAPQKRTFLTGPHRFGVSAKMAGTNLESDPYQCMTFAQVLPDNPTSPAPRNSSPKK